MLSNKKAIFWKVLPLAVVALAAGMATLFWPGTAPAEAQGRSVTLTRNELSKPGNGHGNAPCLQSFVEWEPVGPKVEVEFLLQRRAGNSSVWKIQGIESQALPGRATGAAVSWNNVAPGFEYRHIFRMYTVKGKDGADRNRQLASEFSLVTPEIASCDQ